MSAPPDLRALIASRGSVRRVALAIGLPRRTLESWLAGARKPHPVYLAMACQQIEALEKLRPAPRGRTAR